MKLIRDDLALLSIAFDAFVSERELTEAGAIDKALSTLDERGLVYVGMLEPPKGKPPPEDWEPRPLTLFRATQFGDEVDRPLKKSDGTWTYFAADVAYHRDKFVRGWTTLIDVWGADHGGYVKRMQAAVKALTDDAAVLDVKLCQLVNLFDKGVPVRMSKRAGTFVTLREVIDEVGKDVFRFIMLTRRNDQALDFDFAKVTEQSKDNPVFYVQYAHARLSSLARNASALGISRSDTPDLSLLDHERETELLGALGEFPRIVASAAELRAPHRVAHYLEDLAGYYHRFYDACRVLPQGDEPATPLTDARLWLCEATRVVLENGLGLLGVTAPERM
jgi:arginyl-tRNA synthetase